MKNIKKCEYKILLFILINIFLFLLVNKFIFKLFNKNITYEHFESNNIVEINNIKYLINNENDYIQKCLLNGKQWNKDLINFIKKLIQKNNLKHFVNIGCHIGTVAIPISKIISNVSAIEAYPPTYQHLMKNISINNIKNINAMNIGVGDKEEKIFFMSQNTDRIKNNSGGMHVFTESDIKNNIRSSNLSDKKITNKIYKFDNLDIDNFDIMLIDIEGSENEFLNGAIKKLKKNKPIIILEIWNDNKRKSENMNTTQQDIINRINNLGYRNENLQDDDFIFYPI